MSAVIKTEAPSGDHSRAELGKQRAGNVFVFSGILNLGIARQLTKALDQAISFEVGDGRTFEYFVLFEGASKPKSDPKASGRTRRTRHKAKAENLIFRAFLLLICSFCGRVVNTQSVDIL